MSIFKLLFTWFFPGIFFVSFLIFIISVFKNTSNSIFTIFSAYFLILSPIIILISSVLSLIFFDKNILIINGISFIIWITTLTVMGIKYM